jgi:hypothetical protein
VRKTEIRPPGLAGIVETVGADEGTGTAVVVVVGTTVAGPMVVDVTGLGGVVTLVLLRP